MPQATEDILLYEGLDAVPATPANHVEEPHPHSAPFHPADQATQPSNVPALTTAPAVPTVPAVPVPDALPQLLPLNLILPFPERVPFTKTLYPFVSRIFAPDTTKLL